VDNSEATLKKDTKCNKYISSLHFKESMEKIGCTSPFGFDLDNICTETNKGKKAYSLFKDMFYRNNVTKECLYPCNFLLSWMKPMQERKDSKLDSYSTDYILLRFEKYIKVTTSSYAYTELELLAELGGYAGLFLGLSVFDLRLAFYRICNILRPN
jgi:hypothetical protein